MLNDSSGFIKIVLSVLFFPLFFQETFLKFAWGELDPPLLMLTKRLFLLLPVLAIILGCWVSMACLITIIFRQNRQHFIIALLVTWWDMGKAMVAFWGGVFKFVFNFVVALFELIKILVLGLWSLIQEILFMPFRLIRNVGKNVVSSGVPWIAFILTIFWCLIEAMIFTYVTTPLVVDTFSNITGEQLSASFVRIPLYIFLLFIIMGSYAVLSTFLDAAKSKNISAILGIGVIEIVTLLVEVIFLYREFVDSLVPWFAQYSQNFELGIFWTLAIAAFVWFGVRSLSWFLFASHGTPTLLAIIQGKGFKVETSNGSSSRKLFSVSSEFMGKIRKDMEWIEEKSENLLAAFLLPPLQVVASAINFCTLLITSKHLFELPFKSINDIKKSTVLIESLAVSEKKSKRS